MNRTQDRNLNRLAGHAGTRWTPNGHLILLATAFTFVAVYGSLVPLRCEPMSVLVALRAFPGTLFANLNALSPADLLSNLLLFVPLGFFWSAVVSLDRPLRETIRRSLLVVGGCAALSLTLEFVQCWFPARTVSASDLFAETIGAAVGAGIWIAAGQSVADWLRTRGMNLRPNGLVDWLLEAYFLGLLVCLLMPFDLTISVEQLHGKFAAGRIALTPPSWQDASASGTLCRIGLHLLLFLPVGALAATALTPGNRPAIDPCIANDRGRSPVPRRNLVDPRIDCAKINRTLAGSLLLGAALVLVIEMAQLLVQSRCVAASDLLIGMTGVAAGAWLTRRRLGAHLPLKPGTAVGKGHATSAWLALAALYAGLLVVGSWLCFDSNGAFDFSGSRESIHQKLGTFFDVSFSPIEAGSRFDAVRQLLFGTLSFAPLGAMFALAADSLRLPSAIHRLLLAGLLVVAFALAMGIELGQVMMPNKVADFSEVLLCTTGAALGMFITVRVRRAMGTAPPSASNKNSGTKAGISC